MIHEYILRRFLRLMIIQQNGHMLTRATFLLSYEIRRSILRTPRQFPFPFLCASFYDYYVHRRVRILAVITILIVSSLARFRNFSLPRFHHLIIGVLALRRSLESLYIASALSATYAYRTSSLFLFVFVFCRYFL